MKQITEYEVMARSTEHRNSEKRWNSGQFKHKKEAAHIHPGCISPKDPNAPPSALPGKAPSQWQRWSCNTGPHLRGKVLQKDKAYQLQKAPFGSHGKSRRKTMLKPRRLLVTRPESILLQRAWDMPHPTLGAPCTAQQWGIRHPIVPWGCWIQGLILMGRN